MDGHIRTKMQPAASAAEVEKWCSSLDFLGASRLYDVNILVHEAKNLIHNSPSWQVFNPHSEHDQMLHSQDLEKFSLFINYVNRNHYQVILEPIQFSSNI